MKAGVGTRMRAGLAAAVALAALSFAAPGAGAAIVVNGDFESGTLDGWSQLNGPQFTPAGVWFAYDSETPPLGGLKALQPPPQGKYAATAGQTYIAWDALYQDVALEPFLEHRLSLLAYYTSSNPLVTPGEESIAAGLDPANPVTNMQYRIDVVKPAAELDSTEPEDVLATAMATETGDPQTLEATAFEADLTPFAGQTVRLRVARAANNGYLNAGVDAVAIESTVPAPPKPAAAESSAPEGKPAPAPGPPSNAIAIGKAKLNERNGTARLPVTVPGPGVLRVFEAKFLADTPTLRARTRLVQTATVAPAAAGVANLTLRPTEAGRRVLLDKGRLKIRLALTYTPSGGSAGTSIVDATLRQSPPKDRSAAG